MELKVPRLVRPLVLKEYAPELEGIIWVWVNPPARMLQEYARGREVEDKAAMVEAIKAFLSGVWSAGEAATHWTPEDIQRLMETSVETDPAFVQWALSRTLDMIIDHKSSIKKV